MSPVFVVVMDVLSNQPAQLPLVENDHVIQKFPSNISHPTLSHAVLPRTLQDQVFTATEAANQPAHEITDTRDHGQDHTEARDREPPEPLDFVRGTYFGERQCARKKGHGLRRAQLTQDKAIDSSGYAVAERCRQAVLPASGVQHSCLAWSA